MAMRAIEHKHPRAIRWFHWINFPILTVMIYSGLRIYWAHTAFVGEEFYRGPYRIGFGDVTLLHLFPEWFYEKLDLTYHLAEGMAWHFFFMWIFAINGLLYVAYTMASGEWRYLVPNRRSLKEAIQVTLHDLHLGKVEPPKRKFNGAQQIAYTSIILMGAGSLVTGLAIYKPVQFAWLTSLLGGYQWARWEHFWLTMGFVLFFVVHIAQVVRAGWNNFRAMVTGYEIVDVEEATDERA